MTVSLAGRIEYWAAQAIDRLPAPLQTALSGRAVTTVDGQTLDPGLQLLLAARDLLGTASVLELPPEESRARLRRETRVHRGKLVPVRETRDLLFDAPTGKLRARHYLPAEPGALPLLVYFHGGGMVIGDLETHDNACRALCRYGGMHVLSVEYRLAPEHPSPAAHDDTHAAYRWVRQNIHTLGADPERVGVGGDSAGGNLAAALCQRVRADKELAPPKMQLLIYPAVDRHGHHASLELFASGFMLTRAEVEWYHEQYVKGSGAARTDLHISPLLAPDLSALPPALVVTAGFDPLRDEGEAYAQALQRAGTRAELVRFPGLVHGFINMTGVNRTSRRALKEIAARAGQLLALAP